MQFLIESGTMALVGGVFGVLGGILVAKVITILAGFPSTVAVWSVFAGSIDGHRHGNLLRCLSGAEGCDAGSDRGVEGGVERRAKR